MAPNEKKADSGKVTVDLTNPFTNVKAKKQEDKKTSVLTIQIKLDEENATPAERANFEKMQKAVAYCRSTFPQLNKSMAVMAAIVRLWEANGAPK